MRAAPHNAAIRPIKGDKLDDPAHWATTWAAWKRKRGRKAARPKTMAGE